MYSRYVGIISLKLQLQSECDDSDNKGWKIFCKINIFVETQNSKMTRTKVVSSYYSRTAVEIYIFCLTVKCDSENSELVKVLGPQDYPPPTQRF